MSQSSDGIDEGSARSGDAVMGLFNWLFGLVATKVADKEYGPGQTAFAPDTPAEKTVETPPVPVTAGTKAGSAP